MKRYTFSEYYKFGADGKYTNIVWLCSRGNSRDFGTATLAGDLIRLRPENLGEKEELMVPVKWGKRQYLIRPDELTNFCSAINLGGEPRDSHIGEFLMREGDWDIPVSGRPDLPAGYEGFLLSKTATGKVTEVIDNTSVWIDLGSEHGLKPGMKLLGNGGFLIVEQVYGRQSRAKVRQGDRRPSTGHLVTTAYSDKK
jgi:hypothetical protein